VLAVDRRSFLGAAVSVLAAQSFGFPRLRANELPPEVNSAVTRGLGYLTKVQFRDGHFEGRAGNYPVALSSLAGMAFLMEGSTLREGPYADNIRRLVDWLLDRCRPNGLVGNNGNPQEAMRYTYGHGFGMLFLASVYGEEEDDARQQRLEAVLTRAAEFCGQAQTTKGGWGYLARGCNTEGDDMDEGSTTITQLQALRAARNAGIVVPKVVIDKARKYLEDCTGPDHHVLYRPGMPGPRPALTAAAVACGFSMGEYNSDIVKKWIKAAHKAIGPLGAGGRMGHDEYAHNYLSQAAYSLGDDGYEKLFPGTPENERLTWSGYKAKTFPALVKSQDQDGSWTSQSPWSSMAGPVYTTAVYLSILQLDKGVLPIYQR